MEKRTFGKTGYDVSPIGFGGAPIGFLGTGFADVQRILNLLLDEGVNLIDTAAAYAGSEEAIGKAVSHRRGEFVLVTKCGAPGDPQSEQWTPEGIEKTVDRALTRLQTDYLDVMLLHSCGMELLQQGAALEALVRARKSGKLRHIGYSGDGQAAAYATTLPEIAVLETSINMCDQANIDDVLPSARKNQIGVIAKRPIANAAWQKLSQQPGLYQEYARTYTERLAQMRITPEDLGLSGNDSATWPEIALRFTLAQPGVHTAIIGTTNADHARGNLAAAAKGPLPEELVATVREAFQAAESSSAKKWEAQT